MNAAHTDAWDLPADAPSAFSDLFGELSELRKTPMQPGSVFGPHTAGYNRGASGPRDASDPDAAHYHRAPPPPTAFGSYGGAGPAPARLSRSSQGQQYQSWSLPPASSGGAHAQDPYYHLQQLLNPAGSAPPVCDQPEARVDCVVCYDPLPGRPTHESFSSCHGGQICGGCAAKVDMCPLCRAPKPGREAAVADMLSSSSNCACSVDGPGGDIAAAAAAPLELVESAESAEGGAGVVGVTPRPEGRHGHFDLIAEHQPQPQHADPEALLPPDSLYAAAPSDGFAGEGEVHLDLDTLMGGSQVFRGLSTGPDAELDEFLVALGAGVKVEAAAPDPVQLVLPDPRAAEDQQVVDHYARERSSVIYTHYSEGFAAAPAEADLEALGGQLKETIMKGHLDQRRVIELRVVYTDRLNELRGFSADKDKLQTAPPVWQKTVAPPPPQPQPQQQGQGQRSSRKRKKTAKAEAAEAAAAAAATAPAPPAARGGRAAAAVVRALRDQNERVGRVGRTTAKPTAKPAARGVARATKMARPSPSTVSKPRPWAPKAKDIEVVGAGSPFAGVGLSDDLVCGMPFGDLVAAMKKAGFSKELTAEGKAYRKRLKNRRHVMQYSNRKKAGSTTLSSQNDGLKVKIISLKKRNEKLVSAHGRLNEELRLATVVRHEAVNGIEDLQAQMAALQRAVATLTVGV